MRRISISTLMLIIVSTCFCQKAYIDSLVNTTISSNSIPGLSVGIVLSDTFLLEKGYGYRDVENASLADENTNYFIASLTKAITVYGIGILVDNKQVNWWDPIQKHLKTIHFNDTFSDRVTISDLLSMNLGAPFLDTLLNYPKLSREEINKTISLHSLQNFRSSNHYGQGANIGFYIAGELIEAVSSQSFSSFITSRILQPLAMNNSFVIDSATIKSKSWAKPYNLTSEGLRKIDFPDTGNYVGADGIVSNVHDLTQWIKLLLKIDHQDVMVSNTTFNAIFSPHNILMPQLKTFFNPYSHFNLYGFGWVLSEYRGKLLVEHLGMIHGYTSLIALIPEEKIGIVILTNVSTNNITPVIRDLKFNLLNITRAQ